MNYVVAPEGTYAYTVTHNNNILWDDTHLCPAHALTPDEAALFGVFALQETPEPTFNAATQAVKEVEPAFVDGAWAQQWSVVELAPEEVAAIDAGRVAALWQAAHDIEFNAISGSAVGLIVLGVMQGKPKCMAVQLWIKSLWSLYYERKASGSKETDFSRVGGCPHSVPELMAELGV